MKKEIIISVFVIILIIVLDIITQTNIKETYSQLEDNLMELKENMVNNNIDLYSAVSYDDTDILIIEDFYDIDNGKEFGIWQITTMILGDI